MTRPTLTIPLAAALALALPPGAGGAAELTTRAVEYRQGDAVLEGWLAFDPAGPARRPGVIVVPNWMGVNAQAKDSAQRLARLGFVALVADVYGKGVRPASAKEAGPLAGKYKGDRPLLRARVLAALEELKRQPGVDPAKVVAIGYCFGGTTVLELARAGAPVAGVVSFHGGLGSPTPADARQIKGKVLALHGADDPFVPEAEVKGFEEEMRAAGVDWQLVKYGGAVHAFTDPDAGGDKAKGAAYDAAADRRSWEAMRAFFGEILK